MRLVRMAKYLDRGYYTFIILHIQDVEIDLLDLLGKDLKQTRGCGFGDGRTAGVRKGLVAKRSAHGYIRSHRSLAPPDKAARFSIGDIGWRQHGVQRGFHKGNELV